MSAPPRRSDVCALFSLESNARFRTSNVYLEVNPGDPIPANSFEIPPLFVMTSICYVGICFHVRISHIDLLPLFRRPNRNLALGLIFGHRVFALLPVPVPVIAPCGDFMRVIDFICLGSSSMGPFRGLSLWVPGIVLLPVPVPVPFSFLPSTSYILSSPVEWRGSLVKYHLFASAHRRFRYFASERLRMPQESLLLST